jgi:peptide/nickel transport system permease protein
MNSPNLLAFVMRRPAALAGIVLLALQIAAIIFAPLLATHSPVEADPINSLQPPSLAHWFGTDVSGMDIYSRILFATRVNLLISISAVAIAFAIGVPIGLLIGYYRGTVSSLVMRVFDFIQSFPVFVLGMALVSVMGQEICLSGSVPSSAPPAAAEPPTARSCSATSCRMRSRRRSCRSPSASAWPSC